MKTSRNDSQVGVNHNAAREITPFQFAGGVLQVVPLPDDDVGVVFRSLCAQAGVGMAAQLKRLKRTRARWATVVMMTTVLSRWRAFSEWTAVVRVVCS